MLKNFILEGSSDRRETLAADANDDGTVNASDLTAVITILMGKD